MLERYKLRLGDGTVLMVDHDGLSTWLMDSKAMVQGGRVKHWHPLKEFLAEERVLAKYAARKQARSLSGELPPPLTAPAPSATSAPPAPPVETAPSALASEPFQAPAAPEIAIAPASLPLPVDEPMPPPLPADEPASSPLPAEEPAVMATEPSTPILPEVVASVPVPLPAEETALPLPPHAEIEPPPWASDPRPSEPAPAPEVFEPALPAEIGDPARLLVLADEPASPDEAIPAPLPNDELPVIALKPLDESPSPAPASYGALYGEDEEESVFRARLFQEASPVRKARPRNEPSWLSEVASRINLDEPVRWLVSACEAVLGFWSNLLAFVVHQLAASRKGGQAAPPETGSAMTVAPPGPPVLDEPPPPVQAYFAASAQEPYDPAPPSQAEESALPRLAFETALAQSAPETAFPQSAEEIALPRAADEATLPQATNDSAPSEPYKDEPVAEPYVPAPPREAVKPPPALGQLPVLSLAEFEQPSVVEDVYEGENEHEPSALWPWLKRGLAAVALLATGILAGASWEAWVPGVLQLGPRLFTAIDRQAGAKERAEQQRQALEQATLQLPHLDQETIRRLMAISPSGLLEPAEVFRLAVDASARGVSILSPEEAQELEALWRRLQEGLSPGQRGRMREYDRLRTQRQTYAFEDRAIVELLPAAARKLAPELRERLQVLYGRTVGAGLALPPHPVPDETAKH
jgi:hypothetical protein